jgi:hypothetical protein
MWMKKFHRTMRSRNLCQSAFGPCDKFGDTAVLINQANDITIVAAGKKPLE